MKTILGCLGQCSCPSEVLWPLRPPAKAEPSDKKGTRAQTAPEGHSAHRGSPPGSGIDGLPAAPAGSSIYGKGPCCSWRQHPPAENSASRVLCQLQASRAQGRGGASYSHSGACRGEIREQLRYHHPCPSLHVYQNYYWGPGGAASPGVRQTWLSPTLSFLIEPPGTSQAAPKPQFPQL